MVGVVGAVDETFPDEVFCSLVFARYALTNGMFMI